MPTYTPVDHDPFAAPVSKPNLVPVDHDPFANVDVTANPTNQPKDQLAPASGPFPAVTRANLGETPSTPPQSGVVPPAPAPTPTANADPDFATEIVGSGVKGAHSFNRGRYLLQWATGSRPEAIDDFINTVGQTEAINAAHPVGPSLRKFNEEQEQLKDSGVSGILPSLGVYARNPRATVNQVVESLPSMVPTLATAPLGAVAGMVGGPTGAAMGARVGVGVGSALGDFGGAFEDFVKDNYKPKTPEDWRAILTDPAKYGKAMNYAIAHSGMVGLADMVGMKVGGAVADKLVGDRVTNKVASVAVKGVVGAPASSAVGAVGEAGGQAAGTLVTEGKPRISDPGAVAGEFASGLVTDVGSTALESGVKTFNAGGTSATPVTDDTPVDPNLLGPQAVPPPIPQEGIAPPAPDKIRFYHGTAYPDATDFAGDTFITPHLQYAKDYRGGPNNVLYTDLTKEEAIKYGVWDEINNFPINGSIPEDRAKQFQVFERMADTGLPMIPVGPKVEDISGTFSAIDTPVFYSPLRKYVEEKGGGAADATTWRNMLNNAPGVKQEEIQDLGLTAFFAANPGKITKRELLDHLDEQAIRVEETHRDLTSMDETKIAARARELGMAENGGRWDTLGGAGQEHYYRDARREFKNSQPQYEQYTLPGERQGYTELTMHLPTRNVEGDNTQRDFVGEGHYPEPNIIGHARYTDRIFRDGTPGMLIEEIQATGHQRGRKEGYRDPSDSTSDLVPDLPFKQSWDELVFKRMLRMAADKGYRRVAWVNAKEQSRRYPGDARRDAGMQIFYDKKIPQMAKRWAKWLGGVMGEAQIGGPVDPMSPYYVYDQQGNHVQTFWNEEVARAHAQENGFTYAQKPGEAQTVQYIDLPQAALDTIQRGLPMYSEVAESHTTPITSDAQNKGVGLEIAQRLLPALNDIRKYFGIKAPINVVFHNGTDIVTNYGVRKAERALGKAERFSSGKYKIHVALGNHRNAAEVWATLTHEFGHVVMWSAFRHATKNQKIAIKAAYAEYRANTPHNINLDQLIRQRDNAVVALFNTRNADARPLESPQERQYWAGFEEWFAEQVARWATSSEVPLTMVDKFFKSLGDTLRRIFERASAKFGLPYEPSKAMNDWLNSFRTTAQPFANDMVKQAELASTVENQRHMGPEEKAVERQPELIQVQEGIDKLFNGRPPKEVQETIAYADKFNKIYKWMLGIHQVAQRNQHIAPLQAYTEVIAVAQLMKQQIMIRAQEVLKKWNKLGGDQADRVARLLDDVQNMEYRTPDEVKNKVARFPTETELRQMAAKHGVTTEGLAVFGEVAKTFQEHLVRLDAVLRKEVQKITDPLAQAQRDREVDAYMKNLRSKPYFPAMRFGDYYITIRDDAGKVIHFETFEKQNKRNAAAKEIMARYGVKPDQVKMGVLDRQATTLVGVPKVLLDMMAEKLNLSKAQREALEQLKFELSPAQSFKHRFQHKNRIAGYSQDFRRAYANYFVHGANHLARAMYADNLRDLHKQTLTETKNVMDVTTREEIAKFMNDHLENWLDPKSDWAAIRSLAALWHLAFVPAAATQNLTQTLTTTLPFLAANFGDVKATAQLVKTMANFRTYLTKGKIDMQTGFQMKALARAVADGTVSEAMATEIAAFAETSTLGLGFGNTIQRGFNKINEIGMSWFGLAEKMNRRLVFRATLDLATANPGAKYVKQMVAKHRLQYDQLVREGWTESEAAAYVAARDATNETQFMYGKEHAARLMRGKARSILVFKTFIQSYAVFLANYPAAAVRSLLVLGFLGGFMSFPGAEDMRELIKALAWMWDKNFDVEKEARKWVIHFLGQENGAYVADKILHGVSRTGYGIPFLMEQLGGTVGMNIKLPRFDRSAAISGGTILPVELSKIYGPGVGDPDKAIGQAAVKGAGAGFGPVFDMYKALTNQNYSWSDSKRYEKAMPRGMRDLTKAYRVATEGGERNSKGAVVVPYDVRDSQQLMEVIGMALGYTPVRTSAYWDATMAAVEHDKMWDVRRTGLMKQYGNALLGKDPKEIDRVREAIVQFNNLVKDTSARGKAISSDTLRQSIQTQARSRAAQEAGTSVKKSSIPILQEVKKLYPDAEVISGRRVRGAP